MITRAQGIEWLELAFKKGYRDEYDQQRHMRKTPLAQLIIGPVYGDSDAVLLRDVYRFGRSVGLAQREADLAEEAKVGMEDPICLPDHLFRPRGAA